MVKSEVASDDRQTDENSKKKHTEGEEEEGGEGEQAGVLDQPECPVGRVGPRDVCQWRQWYSVTTDSDPARGELEAVTQTGPG